MPKPVKERIRKEKKSFIDKNGVHPQLLFIGQSDFIELKIGVEKYELRGLEKESPSRYGGMEVFIVNRARFLYLSREDCNEEIME